MPQYLIENTMTVCGTCDSVVAEEVGGVSVHETSGDDLIVSAHAPRSVHRQPRWLRYVDQYIEHETIHRRQGIICQMINSV